MVLKMINISNSYNITMQLPKKIKIKKIKFKNKVVLTNLMRGSSNLVKIPTEAMELSSVWI